MNDNDAIAFVHTTTLLSDAVSTSLPLDGSRSMNGSLNMNCNAINNVNDPVNNQDASTKGYVDTSFNSCLVLNGSRNMHGALNMNSYALNNVNNPVNNRDSSTNNYTDTGINSCLSFHKYSSVLFVFVFYIYIPDTISDNQ